jgi:hypothetical protein
MPWPTTLCKRSWSLAWQIRLLQYTVPHMAIMRTIFVTYCQGPDLQRRVWLMGQMDGGFHGGDSR